MPVDVSYDDEVNTILRFESSGTWVPEEFYDGLLKIEQFVSEANPEPTGVIFEPNGVAPTGLFALLRIGLRFSANLKLPCVIVSPADFKGRFYEILKQYYPIEKLHFAEDVATARTVLSDGSAPEIED